MTVTLEQSYRLCCEQARRAGTNFYISFRALSPAKYRAMCAVYAFMRRSDDIADDAASPASATVALRAWRAQVDAALQGATDDAGLVALADTVKQYRIPVRHLHEVLDGTEMDQHVTRYQTFDELYRYCYRVASCVGLIVLPIFGYRDDSALAPAEACGIAFQLTNILRDVKEDAGRDRIYLPLEDMQRFGVSEADIIQQRFSPAFKALMKFEADRARGYYERAQPLFGLIAPDSRATLAVMVGVYSALLDKIVARDFAVFERRVRLTGPEKLLVAVRSWWRYRA